VILNDFARDIWALIIGVKHMQQDKFSVAQYIVTFCLFLFILSGCGGGESGQSNTANAIGSDANQAPSISGSSPPQAMINTGYNFSPIASDPDGDSLTFTISGRPSWASFNSSTGSLSGTPGPGAIGTYSGIRISVSDGVDSVSLASFSIEVVDQGLGSVSLSWGAPTQNVDGSALTDLAGFKVYYGTSAGAMNFEETIDNPTVTIYLIENLIAGSWFFKVTAFNELGEESVFSNITSRLVQP
jgi:hypothetical protein